MLLRNGIHVCGIRGTNCVTFLLVGNTPAIVDAGGREGHIRKMSRPTLYYEYLHEADLVFHLDHLQLSRVSKSSGRAATESKEPHKKGKLHFPTIMSCYTV